MGFGIGMGDAAGDLGDVDPVGQEAERHRVFVRRLHFQPVPGDGASIQAGRCAGLQPTHHQTRAIEVGRHTGRRGLTMTPCGNALIALVDDAVQESAGRQDDGGGPKFDPLAGRHTHGAGAVHDQSLSRSGHQGEVRRLGQLGLHGLTVQTTINLAAGPCTAAPLERFSRRN